jgi:hypothetical protein
MWMEEEPDQRVNRLRSQDAIATGADIIVTACPYCLQMLQDSIGGLELEKPVEVLDLVELLEKAVTPLVVPAEPAPALEVEPVTSGRHSSGAGGSQGGQETVGVESSES